MPTNKQRRESNRVQLQRQLERRREAEARRRRATLITSIVLTIVLIVGVVVTVVVVSSGDDATKSGGSTATVSFKGVTVGNATNLKTAPIVKSSSTTDPAALEAKDLVVGTGKAASPTSSVTVQYTGVLYKNGTEFDSSWSKGGQPAAFSLSGVVPGFTQGIGGTGSVAPMKVGGRRIIIMPAALGYGAQANGAIPANSSLVFVVDLVSITS